MWDKNGSRGSPRPVQHNKWLLADVPKLRSGTLQSQALGNRGLFYGQS